MNISEITKKYDFHFSKKYGQNFIGDENLLEAIVNDAQITNDDQVLEIGPGAGSLTRVLASKAKTVTAYEIDRSLEPILNETVGALSNVDVIFQDVMTATDEDINESVGGGFKLVANLPYYITTPILFRFLTGDFSIKSITVMVQKEVAERICATPQKGDYGALSVSVALRGKATITRIVNRQNFFPAPDVDSAIVRIDVEKREGVELAKVDKVVKAAFSMKRKTLANNFCTLGLSKDKTREILASLSLSESARAEELTCDDFIRLAEIIG